MADRRNPHPIALKPEQFNQILSHELKSIKENIGERPLWKSPESDRWKIEPSKT